MADYMVKPLGSEITLTTANTVSSATCVRLVNTGATASVITTAGATAGTFTLRSASEVLLKKNPTDTVASDGASTVKASPVAFF